MDSIEDIDVFYGFLKHRKKEQKHKVQRNQQQVPLKSVFQPPCDHLIITVKFNEGICADSRTENGETGDRSGMRLFIVCDSFSFYADYGNCD